MPVLDQVREFAYLDRNRVEDFLSPLLGGIPHEAKEVGKQDPSTTELTVGVQALGVKHRRPVKQMSWEEIRRATPASLFDELVTILREEDAVQDLNGFDRKIWDQLELGEFVAFEGRVESSAMEALVDSVNRFSLG